MKKIYGRLYLSAVLSAALSHFSFAQTGNPTPAPTRAPTPVPVQTPRPMLQSNPGLSNAIENRLRIEEVRRLQKRYEIAARIIKELYREPTKKELITVAVERDLPIKYAEFLNGKKTGVFRLLNDNGCAKNSTVIDVSDECLNRTMPGAGSSFSFRKENYVIPRLADLRLIDDKLLISGEWLHGLIVSIGDVPLEKIDAATRGMKYLADFQPAREYEAAKKIDYKLVEGIRQGTLFYSRTAAVKENETYLLRSVAYRGLLRKSAEGFVYNELDYDKRKDVTIAFRVVRRSSDGSVTIIWKELSSQQSPKLQRYENKVDGKTKESNFIAKKEK